MKINSDDWIKYILGPEILPEEHLVINETIIPKENIIFFLEPISIMTTKDETNLFFRNFAFVDKKRLIDLKNFINKNQNIIGDFLLSLEKKEKVSQYQIINAKKEFVNLIELKSIGKNPEKSFDKNSIEEISRSSMFNKSKNIDISKFYDSIYSHSFEWITNENIKNIAKKLDNKSTHINGKMTKGIPTGPITSKIISEILLTSIMLELSNSQTLKDKDFHVHRFADDFTIYYDYEEDFFTIVKELSQLLNKYKLSINKSKLENNYTFLNSPFKQIHANYGENGNHFVEYDFIKLYNLKNNEITNLIKKNLLNEIQKKNSQKEKSAFYKWILKSWNSNKKIKIIQKDEELTKMFIDFSINYIVISDIGLNIPFNFLNIFFETLKNNFKNMYIKKLLSIYKKTNSQMKMIFIFNFLLKWNFKITADMIDKKWNYILNNNLLLHISQILESKIKNFNDDLEPKNDVITIPKFNYSRISAEWVVWIYASESYITNEIIDEKQRNKMQTLKEHMDFYKPFNYENLNKKEPNK